MTAEKKPSKMKLDIDRVSAVLRPQGEDTDSISKSEKMLVLAVAFLMAMGLWFMVNMDRDFALNMSFDIVHGTLPENRALAEPLPDRVGVTISGVGWKLLNIYNAPPRLTIDLETDELDMQSKMRELMAPYQDVNVLRVQPMFMELKMEPKITKKIPVIADLNITFRTQFDFVGPYQLEPDSIQISGAQSLVEPLHSWSTKNVKLEGVREPIDLAIELSDAPQILELSHKQTRMTARVSEFTEGEVRIPVRSRNMPRGREVNYSPIAVTVRYDVPIDQYVLAQETVPYAAYVTYSQIMQDTTGIVTPVIEQTADDLYLRIRSVQPRSVFYFRVVQN